MTPDQDYHARVVSTFERLRATPPEQLTEAALPLVRDGVTVARLRPLTHDSVHSDRDIQLLADWRRDVQRWFPSQFTVTEEGTRGWLERLVLGVEDKILFMIDTPAGESIGHLGLGLFLFDRKACEIENIVRGVGDSVPGVMELACATLIRWAFEALGNEIVYLRVMADNDRALQLYHRLGFREVRLTPLVEEVEGERVCLVPAPEDPYVEVKRHLMTMRIDRADMLGAEG